MKIVIDIPDEFESHFNCDRFNGSLRRLWVDVHCIAGNYEKELCEILIDAFGTGTLLPKGHGRLIDADALQKQAVKVKLEHVAREIEVVTINQIKEAAAIPIIEGDRKCNQCAFYKGVHNVKGHAPCSKMGIPGVLWNDTCNQFREAEEGKG